MSSADATPRLPITESEQSRMDMHHPIPINPYLTNRESRIRYVDQYFKHLAQRVRALLSGE
jgi:hypothetical protein